MTRRPHRLVTAALSLGVVAASAAVPVASAPAASAASGTLSRTVPATFEFREIDYDGGGTPYCAVAAFVRWASVPGVSSATAKFRWRSAAAADFDGPFVDTTKESAPPFDNTFTVGGATFRVEPGHDWINPVVYSYGGGADCGESLARAQRMVDRAAGATVELDITVPGPTVKSITGSPRLPKSRRAAIGTVTCPPGGACTIKVPKKVRVKRAGVKYVLAVKAPKKLAGGKSAKVRVRFSRAAARELSGARVRPKVAVTAVNQGVARTERTVKRRIRC